MANLRIARSQPKSDYQAQFIEMADRVKAAKERLENAEAECRNATDELAALMSAYGNKSGVAELADGKKYRITVTQAERIDINEGGLRKAVGAVIFDKLCDLKLNRHKLELAVADGRVDPGVVALHALKKFNRPSVRITLVGGDGNG